MPIIYSHFRELRTETLQVLCLCYFLFEALARLHDLFACFKDIHRLEQVLGQKLLLDVQNINFKLLA